MEQMRLFSSFLKSKKGLSQEVNQKRERRSTETPRGFREETSCSKSCMRFQEEEGSPSTSYQQSRRPENPRSPHRSTMPTFFEEGERYSNEEERCKETPKGFQDEEEELYTSYHHKAGRMTKEEISWLLFQTLKGIEEDLKEFEQKR